jgi:bZIP-type transcription factor MBZ1
MYEGPPMGGADPSEFLNMYLLDDDYSKPLIAPFSTPSSAGAAPYDFLGLAPSAFSTFSSASPSSAQDSPIAAAGDDQQMGIDPTLVGTPSIATPEHDQDDEDDDEDDEDEDAEREKKDKEELIAPIKVGGKGKARKGTVASGGIKKLSHTPPATTTSSFTGKENLSGANNAQKEDRESDDWRPSPEEYKKMSSKEKRQLRNKISARNFRVRRKGLFSRPIISA